MRASATACACRLDDLASRCVKWKLRQSGDRVRFRGIQIQMIHVCTLVTHAVAMQSGTVAKDKSYRRNECACMKQASPCFALNPAQ